MEGQRHNNHLNPLAFVYNGPKGMELVPNPHYLFIYYLFIMKFVLKVQYKKYSVKNTVAYITKNTMKSIRRNGKIKSDKS